MLYAVLRTSFTTCYTLYLNAPILMRIEVHYRPNNYYDWSIEALTLNRIESTVLFVKSAKDRSPGYNRVAQTNSTCLHNYVLEKNFKLFKHRDYYLAAFTVYVVILISLTSAGFALVRGESSYMHAWTFTSTSARTLVCKGTIAWRSDIPDYTDEGHMWLGFNYFSYDVIGCLCVYVCDWIPLLKSL